ncbi:MAG TPA: GNAT family N-acetyltransferase [Chitinophagaceae bacterium]|jgi:ribosomal protein S18 acetylase RimI-like enzyme
MSSFAQHDIIIQLAKEEDAELIADLSHKTFYDSYAKYNSEDNMNKFLGEQFTREKLIAEVTQPWHIFFLAFAGSEAVGYVKLREGTVPLSLADQASIEIARIYSVEKMIGKGIGKKLMQISIDTALQKGKKILWLGVWKGNQRAIDFYTKWGFKIVDEQKFLLGDDLQTDWVMVMEL